MVLSCPTPVNLELEELQALIVAAAQILRPGGTLCVISYHSLEDRIVKRAFRPPRPSNPWEEPALTPWLPITTKPIRPSEQEVGENPRAASARLRAVRRKGSGA